MNDKSQAEGLPKHQTVLEKYYIKYLREVRCVSDSSVQHYTNALKSISKRLRDKQLLKNSIYEITNLDYLEKVKSILYSDQDFILLDKRGNRMYSVALNHYCAFAAGIGFHEIREKMEILDIPIAAESSITIQQKVWKRSEILRVQAIELAGYSCELNSSHQTFISAKTNHQYMEGHHALPMKKQDQFQVSLDVYSNIICLCPICHRKIHYGLQSDRILMNELIYDLRATRLANSGIKISKRAFLELALLE